MNTLQRKCENALSAIETLERRKDARAIAASVIFGLIGTIFLALSVFNVAVFTLNIPLVIIFGALGFLGWCLGYFSYVRVKKSQADKIAPLIDEQYDVIYSTCEAAGALLA